MNSCGWAFLRHGNYAMIQRFDCAWQRWHWKWTGNRILISFKAVLVFLFKTQQKVLFQSLMNSLRNKKKRLWVQLLTLKSFSVARLFAGATGCTQREQARQLQRFTNGMVINKYENDEPQHGWFRVTTARFSMPQFLHLLLWNFSHKTLIVIHFAVISAVLFWKVMKSKKFTNYEIMTRSSDNAIAIINWIWTWSDLHSAWLIFCFMLHSDRL